MALQKTKELLSGVSGNYWKIISVHCDRLKLTLSCDIALFKDKPASDAGKPHMGLTHSFDSVKTKAQLAGDLTELAYQMITAQTAGVAPSIMSGKVIAYNDLKNSINI